MRVPVALGTQTDDGTAYAYKPTRSMLRREGQKIHLMMLDASRIYSRRVADLRLVANVLNARDDEMSAGVFSVRGARFGLLVWPIAGSGAQAAMAKAGRLLHGDGATMEEPSPPPSPDLNVLPGWQGTVMAAAGGSAFLPEYATAKDKLWQYAVGSGGITAGLTRR
ncbi:glutamyl-tRNA(Gln) amidotransferase subunit A [Magnaporthiopsis poae ATCC 64411]|uniref:Glutamyl-tRNA(Gln) amidotransferase subunit A n=1 Tax=Magnaporthiopsis poae (strain ATCC 64411 / 73-15) TaxID=644358 RepID=A0A0C4EFE6_MAGP6|nr:glutamyl-tRNA(Gln) amidotransferase subunit A [Magnaporthiopsis poae ATCC 64411]